MVLLASILIPKEFVLPPLQLCRPRHPLRLEGDFVEVEQRAHHERVVVHEAADRRSDLFVLSSESVVSDFVLKHSLKSFLVGIGICIVSSPEWNFEE